MPLPKNSCAAFVKFLLSISHPFFFTFLHSSPLSWGKRNKWRSTTRKICSEASVCRRCTPRLTDGNRAEGIGREIEGEELLTSVEKNGGGKDYRSHRTSFTQGVPKEGMEQDPEMYLSSEGAGSGRKRIVLLVVSTKTNGLTSCITTANPKTP